MPLLTLPLDQVGIHKTTHAVYTAPKISFQTGRIDMLCRLEVGRNELPEAFEAEERSLPGLGDLLHLVSGQTMLGSVRERHAQNLGSPGHRAAHLRARCTDAPAQLSSQDSGPSTRKRLSVSADAAGSRSSASRG